MSSLYRGFTKFARVDYVKWKEENRLVNDGVTAKVSYIVMNEELRVFSLFSLN